MSPLNSSQISHYSSEERISSEGSLRKAFKVRTVRFSIVLAPLFAMAMLPAFGADNGYNGGQPTNPKDLKGKKIVLAHGPKLIGICYFSSTTKGEAETATELT